MQKIELFISLTATAIGLLISTITYIIKFVQTAKAKQYAEALLQIRAALLPLIEQAESISTLNGEQKQAYVLNQIEKYSQENNLYFNPALQEATKDIINSLVSMSKKVNTTVQK